MLLKIEDILAYAVAHNSGRDILSSGGKYYLNEALNELATRFDSACKAVRFEQTFLENTWTDLPSDLIALKYVEVDGAVLYDYTMEFGQIKFTENITAKLVYLRAPVKADIVTDYPEIHDLYHPILAIFIGARSKQRDYGSYDSDSQRLLQEFYDKSKEVDSKLMFQDRRTMNLRR